MGASPRVPGGAAPPQRRAPAAAAVRVAGGRVRLTNPDKVLYPATGFTKAQVVDHYARLAEVILPHLRARPATFRRFPDGVEAEGFYTKAAPRGRPAWVRTVTLPTPSSTKGRSEVEFVVVDDLATLVWSVNLAALEIHVPQWTVGPRGGVRDPDRIIFDLDPGEPATVVECCRVALLIREVLAADGLTAVAKTSGSKGLQLYAPVRPTSGRRVCGYARTVAERLAADHPDLVVAEMARRLRVGRVFIDWSQNNPAKTTVAPYSLRARAEPTVSTPVTWDEVAAARDPARLRFRTGDVVARVERDGDLLAPLLADERPALPR